jgi:PHD/YefM family antitoxin component YafN of YafNO toxin-antitoxin module
MRHINANELKTRGVVAIEQALADKPEAIVSVRGKERFVVMDLAQYQHFRECELEMALAQSRADLQAGKVARESPEKHVARLKSKT